MTLNSLHCLRICFVGKGYMLYIAWLRQRAVGVMLVSFHTINCTNRSNWAAGIGLLDSSITGETFSVAESHSHRQIGSGIVWFLVSKISEEAGLPETLNMMTTYLHSSRMGSGEQAVTNCDMQEECDLPALDFIGESQLPRLRQPPKRLDSVFPSVKDYY